MARLLPLCKVSLEGSRSELLGPLPAASLGNAIADEAHFFSPVVFSWGGKKWTEIYLFVEVLDKKGSRGWADTSNLEMESEK